jgi:DNA topoisomerase-2
MNPTTTENKLKISDFYKKDYTQFASYDGQRKIANYIDGLKISQRKVIFTLLNEPSIGMIKVDALASTTAMTTLYIHGASSLEDVAVNLATDYTGANNIPLLKRSGNFGSRLINEASATRYIQAGLNPVAKKIFNKDDNEIIAAQVFEGKEIEPSCYFPRLPMILVNGSKAIAVGFSQSIQPRNPVSIKKAIGLILDGVSPKDKRIVDLLIPWYSGFTGEITHVEENTYRVTGKIERDTNTSFYVNEVPIGYSHSSYQKKLEALYEKKIITDYKDLCDTKNDKFRFLIKCDRTLTKKTDAQILKELGLISSITDVLTTIDENGKIVVFESVGDLLYSWVEKRREFVGKRISHNIYKLLKKRAELIVFTAYVTYVQNKIVDFVNSEQDDFISEMKKSFNTFDDEILSSVLRMQLASIRKINTDTLPVEIAAIDKEVTVLQQKQNNVDSVIIEELV